MLVKTVVACFVWLALTVGAVYLMTGMTNDALDEKVGQVAGIGVGAIVSFTAVSAIRRKKASVHGRSR